MQLPNVLYHQAFHLQVALTTVNTGVYAALADKLHPKFGNSYFGKKKFKRNQNKSKVDS